MSAIITGDIAQLMDTFGKIVSARDLERSTKDIQELCQVMEIPTDDLIAMYNANKVSSDESAAVCFRLGRSGIDAH